MSYLLDTNIFIAALKAHPAVRMRLERIPAAEIILSPIVLGELELGVEKSARIEHNRTRLDQLISGFSIVPIDAACARRYARIRAGLERSGTPIGANDLWIAAQALALDAVLVTHNIAEFARIEKLRIEDWLDERFRPA